MKKSYAKIRKDILFLSWSLWVKKVYLENYSLKLPSKNKTDAKILETEGTS